MFPFPSLPFVANAPHITSIGLPVPFRQILPLTTIILYCSTLAHVVYILFGFQAIERYLGYAFVLVQLTNEFTNVSIVVFAFENLLQNSVLTMGSALSKHAAKSRDDVLRCCGDDDAQYCAYPEHEDQIYETRG